RGRVLSRVRKLLESHSFAVESICVDAREMGVPQRRRRHFLVAFAKMAQARWRSLPRYLGAPSTVGDVLEALEDEPNRSTSIFTTPSRSTKRNLKRISHLFETGSYNLPDSRRPPCHKNKHHTYKAVYGRLRWDGNANTITSGFGSMGQGRYVHPTRLRLITPHEAARLQGFPDL